MFPRGNWILPLVKFSGITVSVDVCRRVRCQVEIIAFYDEKESSSSQEFQQIRSKPELNPSPGFTSAFTRFMTLSFSTFEHLENWISYR